MLADICYEKIMDNFWFANYLGLKVIMMKDNGYINVTKLCSDGGKQFKHWKALKNSKAMMSFYEKNINQTTDSELLTILDNQLILSDVIPSDEPANWIKVIHTYTGGKGDTYDVCRGTYIHPLLIPHIASWINFEFAYNVSIIIQDFTVKFYKAKCEEMQNALLLAEIELSNTEQSFKQLMDEKLQVEQQHATLQDEHCFEEHEHIAACELINKQRSKMYNWSQGNGFTLLKKNNDDRLPYYAIRCNDKNMPSCLKRLQKPNKFPNSTVIFQTSRIPSGLNLYQKMKNISGISFYRNHFSFASNENELKTRLEEICDID